MASSDVPGPGQFTFVRKEDRGGNDGGNMAAAFARAKRCATSTARLTASS